MSRLVQENTGVSCVEIQPLRQTLHIGSAPQSPHPPLPPGPPTCHQHCQVPTFAWSGHQPLFGSVNLTNTITPTISTLTVLSIPMTVSMISDQISKSRMLALKCLCSPGCPVNNKRSELDVGNGDIGDIARHNVARL